MSDDTSESPWIVWLPSAGFVLGWLLLSAGLAMHFGWWVLVAGVGLLLVLGGAFKLVAELAHAYLVARGAEPPRGDVHGDALRRTRSRVGERTVEQAR